MVTRDARSGAAFGGARRTPRWCSRLERDSNHLLKDQCEDDGGYTIHPLQFAEIDDQSRLMVVNCHYEMSSRQKKGGLTFDVSPDSITFHLFEAAATR